MCIRDRFNFLCNVGDLNSVTLQYICKQFCFQSVKQLHCPPIKGPDFTAISHDGLIRVIYNLNFIDWLTILLLNILFKAKYPLFPAAISLRSSLTV